MNLFLENFFGLIALIIIAVSAFAAGVFVLRVLLWFVFKDAIQQGMGMSFADFILKPFRNILGDQHD